MCCICLGQGKGRFTCIYLRLCPFLLLLKRGGGSGLYSLLLFDLIALFVNEKMTWTKHVTPIILVQSPWNGAETNKSKKALSSYRKSLLDLHYKNNGKTWKICLCLFHPTPSREERGGGGWVQLYRKFGLHFFTCSFLWSTALHKSSSDLYCLFASRVGFDSILTARKAVALTREPY